MLHILSWDVEKNFSPSFRNIFSVRCEYRVKKKKGNRKFFSKRWKVQMSDDLNKFDLKRKGKISFRKFSFLRFPRKLNFRIKRFSALDIEVEFNFERNVERSVETRLLYLWNNYFPQIIFNNFNTTKHSLNLNLMINQSSIHRHAFSTNIHTCDYSRWISISNHSTVRKLYIHMYPAWLHQYLSR